MAAAQDVHVRICNQEIVRFDLEVKALIQVLIPGTLGPAVLTRLTAELSPFGQVSQVAGPAPWPAYISSYPFGPFPLIVYLEPPSGCRWLASSGTLLCPRS